MYFFRTLQSLKTDEPLKTIFYTSWLKGRLCIGNRFMHSFFVHNLHFVKSSVSIVFSGSGQKGPFATS